MTEESAVRVRTGLVAGGITLGLFVVVGLPMLLLSSNRQIPSNRQMQTNKLPNMSVDADIRPKIAAKSSDKYPYPECEACVAWLRENVGDPKSLEIIRWAGRDETEMQWNGPPGPMEKVVSVKVKYRAKNNVGAMDVDTMIFVFRAGKIAKRHHVQE